MSTDKGAGETPETLLRELLAKATPVPWEPSTGYAVKFPDGWGSPRHWTYVRHNFPDAPYEGELDDEWGIYPPLGESGPVALVSGEANAKLIVAAVNALPALLARVSALTEALERLSTGEGFVAIGGYPDDMWGREVKARIDYARAALSADPEPKAKPLEVK